MRSQNIRGTVETRLLSGLCGLLLAVGPVCGVVQAEDHEGVARLRAATGNSAKISFDRATGTVSFVRLQPGTLRLTAEIDASRQELTMAFLEEYGSIFGLQDADS